MQRARRTSLSETDRREDSGEPADDQSAGSSTSPSTSSAASAETEVEESGSDDPGTPVSRRRMTAMFAAVAVLVLGLDQLTKAIVLAKLEPGEPVNVIGSLLRFNLVKNPGAAFSLGTGYTVVLTVIAVGVAAAVINLSRRLHSIGWTVAFGLLLGGAAGNLADRFFRDPAPFRGHVVDFMQLPHWAIFNCADTAIVTAACLMVLQTLRGVGLDGRRDLRAR